jgi:3-oxoacyl-[acyl-carrier-protein] synthase II
LVFDLGRVEELPVASMPDASEVPGLDLHLAFLDSQDAAGYRDLAYALLAIELALADAGLSYDRDDNHVGVVQAFEAPGVERTVGELFALFGKPMPTDAPPPVYDMLSPYFYAMQPFFYVHLVGKAFGVHGFSTSVHNACSSGAVAIEVAAERIRTGQAEVMIVAAGEAFDTGVRLEWFRRLDLYAKTAQMCPFDAGRQGFYVGEGAAAMVLESADHAAKRDAKPIAKYLGGSFTQQSWKQVIPNVRSSHLTTAVETAMASTKTSWADVDLITPHGACTQLSDGYESTCLRQAIGDAKTPAIGTALKPHVGHMLAASGIVETVCALLAIRHQTVPATLNTQAEDATLPVPLATTTTKRQVKRVLKLSTGFTGHDAASLFAAI